MPVILFIICLVWLLSTMAVDKGKIAIGSYAQDKQSSRQNSFLESITNKSLEYDIDDFIRDNRSAAWDEADMITKDLPTWKKVRELGYEPRVSPLDIKKAIMAMRYGKLPALETSYNMFNRPFYLSKSYPSQYNEALSNEFMLGIENALRAAGRDVFLVVETREYDKRNKAFNRLYTFSKILLPNGEKGSCVTMPRYFWSGFLTPAEQSKLDTGLPIYGTDFIGF